MLRRAATQRGADGRGHCDEFDLGAYDLSCNLCTVEVVGGGTRRRRDGPSMNSARPFRGVPALVPRHLG